MQIMVMLHNVDKPHDHQITQVKASAGGVGPKSIHLGDLASVTHSHQCVNLFLLIYALWVKCLFFCHSMIIIKLQNFIDGIQYLKF